MTTLFYLNGDCPILNKYRYFIELAFKGTVYHGWQIQKNAISIQEVLNKALSTLLRHPIESVGCGRTDTGVHAIQFYVHFDSNQWLGSPSFIVGLNALLPRDIAVKRIIEVEANAHARFDAILRSYEYHIHFSKDPFLDGFSWLMRDRPRVDLMNKAAKIITEYQDFSCFSKSNTQTFTNNCIISRAEWVEDESKVIFYISANRFLRNMVRAIVGTLLRIGQMEMEPEGIRYIIESKNRAHAGVSVPAHGLYLTEVIYTYIKKYS